MYSFFFFFCVILSFSFQMVNVSKIHPPSLMSAEHAIKDSFVARGNPVHCSLHSALKQITIPRKMQPLCISESDIKTKHFLM